MASLVMDDVLLGYHGLDAVFWNSQFLERLPLRTTEKAKAAKIIQSQRVGPTMPRFLKRYLGGGGFKVLSRMDRDKTMWRWRSYFFARQI
jgi:hypothetical protein